VTDRLRRRSPQVAGSSRYWPGSLLNQLSRLSRRFRTTGLRLIFTCCHPVLPFEARVLSPSVRLVQHSGVDLASARDLHALPRPTGRRPPVCHTPASPWSDWSASTWPLVVRSLAGVSGATADGICRRCPDVNTIGRNAARPDGVCSNESVHNPRRGFVILPFPCNVCSVIGNIDRSGTSSRAAHVSSSSSPARSDDHSSAMYPRPRPHPLVERISKLPCQWALRGRAA
jgi:hypothetical protein